ncbi:MAG: choice-of-anchor D domain-containing protein [Bacteroidales bacterium]
MKNSNFLYRLTGKSMLIFSSFLIIGSTLQTLQANPGEKDWTILQSWDLTAPGQASGLAWDGTYFYYGIYGVNGDQVYRFDPSDGNSVLQFTSTSLGDAYGMTYDGSHLWITDHVTSTAIPAFAMQFDLTGNVLQQIDLPAHYMSGIAYDDGDFWVAAYSPDPSTIYKVDNAGNVLSQFQAPDNQPWDLCRENDNLWMVDYYGDMIYKTDLSGNLLESHASENIQPSGIEYDGQFLWYLDGANGTSKIYKIDLGGAGTPQINIPVTTYNFGSIAVGDSVVWNCTVTNTGTADLEITNLVIQNAVPIFVYMPFPQLINPGNSIDIPFNFKPSEIGSLNTIVSVHSTDPVDPEIDITLLGEAVFDGLHIFVPTASHNYGTMRMNATKRWYLEIVNDGNQTLEISDITIDDDHFYLDESIIFPINIGVLESASLGIWFFPDDDIAFSAIASISHNDISQGNINVNLSGSAIDEEYPMGESLWNYTINTSWDNSVKAITPVPDISGDGVPDIVVGSEDGYVRCFNGNASGLAEVLWENEIGSVYNQNDLCIINDINSDGYDDVIAGKTGIGAVNALSGKTGVLLWSFSTQQFGDGGWIYQVWCGFDYNEDGSNDVLASSGGTAQGSRRIFCIDGITGNAIWVKFTDGPNFSVIGVEDFTGDGIPDVIGGASNANETEGKVLGINGENGNIEWFLPTEGSSVWALEQADDLNNDDIKDIIAGCSLTSRFYLINPVNGSVINSNPVGSSFILRFEKLDDVNADGYSDFALAKSGNQAIVVDGYNGNFIWDISLADQSWNIDRIEDVSGDGINDVIIGTLYSSNYCYFLDGTSGATLHSFNFIEAVDGISAMPDITGDGSWEMVAGGRNGKLYCYSGGLNSATMLADFIADETYGFAPFDVQFTDLSIGDITSWEWDFENDGIIDSYEQNPMYTFENYGIYSVKLIITNENTSDTLLKPDYITADTAVGIRAWNKPDQIKACPNPFSNETTILISNPGNGLTDLYIYNSTGHIVNVLKAAEINTDNLQFQWNGKDDQGNKLDTGIYFGKIYGNGSFHYLKLILK